MRKSRLVTSAAIALAGLTLSSCGSAMPGVAARVGDTDISNSAVDEATQDMCTALGDQLESGGTVLPMSFIRQGVLQLLVLRTQAEAIADEFGVEAGSDYQRGLDQQEAAAAAVPESVRADYVELTSTNAYASDILDQVGRIRLEEQGVDEPTSEEVTQAGIEIFTVWPDANGIEIDPRYGMESKEGVLSPVDTNVSVAVSDQALGGLGLEPDPAFTATLPPDQRCG